MGHPPGPQVHYAYEQYAANNSNCSGKLPTVSPVRLADVNTEWHAALRLSHCQHADAPSDLAATTYLPLEKNETPEKKGDFSHWCCKLSDWKA